MDTTRTGPLRGSISGGGQPQSNPANTGRLTGPTFSAQMPRHMQGNPHLFWGPRINVGNAGIMQHWMNDNLRPPKAEAWWSPSWLSWRLSSLARWTTLPTALLSAFLGSKPLNEDDALNRQRMMIQYLNDNRDALKFRSVLDFGQLEDPNMHVIQEPVSHIRPDALSDPVARFYPERKVSSHPEPLREYSRVQMPGVTFDELQDYLPLPEPGHWTRGVIEIREDSKGPHVRIRRAVQADKRIDKPQQDYKSYAVPFYKSTLYVINRTYGTYEEIKEFKEAVMNNLVTNEDVKMKDLTFTEALEMVLEGRAWLDVRGFTQDLALNVIEDMAYGAGGKLQTLVQKKLRLPPGLLTAWNQSIGKTHPELNFSISKAIGDAVMEKVRSQIKEQDNVRTQKL